MPMLYDSKHLDQFPVQPGVYLMKDEEGAVLYVGKAKNLRLRVKQYFIPGRDGRLMIPYLVSRIYSIETIVVFSEKEALLLENTLIKLHQPKYNALLKDDKGYIALKISFKEKWPSIKLVRYKGNLDPDGLYFGPYTSAKAAGKTLDLLNKLFPLRQCSDEELARRVRPCLLFEMKRCAGPCVGKCTEDEYEVHLKRTIKFLRGQDKEVLKDLYEEMERRSEALEFEKAGQILNAIRYIERTIEIQHVDRLLGHDADAIGLYRQGNDVVLSQLFFRHGKLIGSRHYSFNNIAEEDDELITSFLLQHYEGGLEIPPEILLPVKVSDQAVLEELLSSKRKSKVILTTPKRGGKKSLQQMAEVNAEAYYQSQKDEEQFTEQLLLDIQEILKLSRYPKIIECFDISHTSGMEAVASMVTFVNGKKESKHYRLYRLNLNDKPDDYAAMHEVLSRRYKRAKKENTLPDLVIVDGGRGQLNIAIKVLEELYLAHVDVIGLAKEKGRHDKGLTKEQIFLRGFKEPLLLKKNSPVLFLFQQLRDEAHRFAINFHRKRRSKKALVSQLDDVPGIGPKKRKALFHHFGSLKSIKQASLEELCQVKGIHASNAAAIRAAFPVNQ